MVAHPSSNRQTAEKESWRQLNAGFFMVRNGFLVHVDGVFIERFGYHHPSEVLGGAIMDLVHPQDRGLAEVLRSSSPLMDTYTLPLRFKKKEGGYLLLIVQGGTALLEGATVSAGCLFDPSGLDMFRISVLAGRSSHLQELAALIKAFSEIEATVLITGEKGTGKTAVARFIHYNGHRSARPFTSIICSVLTEHALDDLLFDVENHFLNDGGEGKSKAKSRPYGGTVLLEEIGELSLPLQHKLLRFLQAKAFLQGDGMLSPTADIRLMATSSKDLAQQVKIGQFTEDLYSGLKAVNIHLLPLRQRRKDIPVLVEHYCRLYSAWSEAGIKTVSSAALRQLMDYRWPGNGRELAHVMARACLLSRDNTIDEHDLPADVVNAVPLVDDELPIAMAKKRSERSLKILDALNKALWNKTKAAQYLGISRQTLYRQMKTYGLKTIGLK